MTLNKAISTLRNYQSWRRDSNVPSTIEQPNPTEIGLALDLLLAQHETKSDIGECGESPVFIRDEIVCTKALPTPNIMEQEKISEFLKEQRSEKGWSQTDLANQLNVSLRTIQHWENNEKSMSLPMFFKVVELFEYTVFLSKDTKEIK